MNPKQLAEKAVINYLATQDIDEIPAAQFYRGFQNSVDNDEETTPQTMVLPCVVCEAEGEFEEVAPFTLNYRGILSVNVIASAHDTTHTDFDTACREVFSKFGVAGLAASISSATTSFHCYHARALSAGTTIRNGSNWENSLKLEMVFCPSDLA